MKTQITHDSFIDCVNGCYRFWIGNKLDSTYYQDDSGLWVVDFGHEQLFTCGSEVEAKFCAISGEAVTRAIMNCSVS